MYKRSIPGNQGKRITGAMFLLLLQLVVFSQKTSYTPVDPKPFGDSERHWYSIVSKENMINAVPNQPRYKPSQVIEIADNIVLYQKSNGGWPKNYDMLAILTEDQKKIIRDAHDEQSTTFDNSTTYTHIACLSKIYEESKIEKYKDACVKGLNFILAAQFKNGGWPQYFPLRNDYSRYVTYNDDAMTGVMELLKDIADRKKDYAYVEGKLFERLKTAYEKGLQCILKTQIKDNGKLTAWCQQYDENLEPAWARKFEPPSICNGESCEILKLLMSIKHPDAQIKTSISSAVEWFRESRIYGIRVKTIEATPVQFPFRKSHTDRVVVTDSTAPPIWTRYYELKTHRPLFCNRDSKVVYSLADVERERRDGYGWYTYAPQGILDTYNSWLKRISKD